MSLKFRMATGTNPIVVVVKGLTSGTTLHSVSTSSDQITVPDSVTNALTEGIIVTATDAGGNVATLRRSLVDLQLLKMQIYCGTTANPSVDDAIERMNHVKTKGGNVVSWNPNLWSFNINNDNDMNNWANGAAGTYDPTVAPPGGVYVYPSDRLFRAAYLAGMKVKSMIHLAAEPGHLNSGSSRTRFFGLADAMMQWDGQPLVTPGGGDMVPGSYKSSVFLDFGSRMGIGFMKRYWPTFNSGLSLCMGWSNTNSGEGEYETGHTTAGNDQRGDFHPSMMSAFRTKYTAYNSTSNLDISNQDRTPNSQLARRWSHFLGQALIEAEAKWVNDIKAAVPQLNRYLWDCIDSGSCFDGLMPKRRTQNWYVRTRPTTFLLKTNDNPHSDDWNRFVIACLSSGANKFGCQFMIETSPTDLSYAGFASGESTNMNMQATSIGGGVSMFGVNAANAFYDTGSLTRTTRAAKPEYVSGQLKRFTWPVSNVYNTNSTDEMRAAYGAFLTANSVTHADIVLIDDIN